MDWEKRANINNPCIEKHMEIYTFGETRFLSGGVTFAAAENVENEKGVTNMQINFCYCYFLSFCSFSLKYVQKKCIICEHICRPTY